jgi:hypothetical protein
VRKAPCAAAASPRGGGCRAAPTPNNLIRWAASQIVPLPVGRCREGKAKQNRPARNISPQCAVPNPYAAIASAYFLHVSSLHGSVAHRTTTSYVNEWNRFGRHGHVFQLLGRDLTRTWSSRATSRDDRQRWIIQAQDIYEIFKNNFASVVLAHETVNTVSHEADSQTECQNSPPTLTLLDPFLPQSAAIQRDGSQTSAERAELWLCARSPHPISNFDHNIPIAHWSRTA